MIMRQHPRMNRVTPSGEIVAIEARGRAMGNRGNLLDETGQVVKEYAIRRWICCTLEEVNGRKVQFENPYGYTPLFFTDEAVALAAGHRPCGSCRPAAYYQWLAIWKQIAGVPRSERVLASTMDRDLHRRRRATTSLWHKTVRLSEVPEGAFVSIGQLSPKPMLLWEGRLWAWDSGGYSCVADIDSMHRDLGCRPFPGTRFLAAGFRFDDELRPMPAEQAR